MQEQQEAAGRSTEILYAEIGHGRMAVRFSEIEALEPMEGQENPERAAGIRLRCRSGCWLWIKVPEKSDPETFFDEVSARWSQAQGGARPSEGILHAESRYGRIAIRLDEIETVEEVQEPEHPRGEVGIRLRCRSDCGVWINVPEGSNRAAYFEELTRRWAKATEAVGASKEG